MKKKNTYRPYSGHRHRRIWSLLFGSLSVLLLLFFAILEGAIYLHGRTDLSGAPKVMVVFGCKVEERGPSLLLQDRLDTALDYWKENPDTLVVVTGGKGKDEPISEAQSMYDYLTANGVEGEKILMEDRSRNTWQNVNYTLDLLEEKGIETTDNVVAVSSGFHLLRIEMLWERAGGGELAGTLAAPVTHRPSAVQMFFREPLALVKSFLMDR